MIESEQFKRTLYAAVECAKEKDAEICRGVKSKN
jgi:hypothetical protein